MSSADDRRRQLELSNAYLSGEKILGVKFCHNSHVRFIDAEGKKAEGWIVSVGPIEPIPIYTVERSDGHGDDEVPETNVELIFDPHEK